MSEILAGLPQFTNPDLLVGFDSSDDAAVYRLDETRAVVSTVDFITPPVDDPFRFGQIAAANSLSDIYAMGAKPLFALNLVMFPAGKLANDVLAEILRGAAETVKEAGAVLAGGHSVDDDEPKFGLCVTGSVEIADLLTNGGAQSGDAIILTKPLGTGVLFNAVLAGRYSSAALEKSLPDIARLNGAGLDVLRRHGVRALTDVTGFGLAGHLLEMAEASGVTVRVSTEELPLYPGALAMYAEGITTGSNIPNRQNVAGEIRITGSSPEEREEILFDPQTSGGLLAAVPASEATRAIEGLRAEGYPESVVIGEAVDRNGEALVFE